MITDEASARVWLTTVPGYDNNIDRRLEQFAALLSEENQGQNLVSRNSLNQIWQRHIADSAQLLLHVPRETSGPWLDLGTGAGFPGMVIAIFRPDLVVHMVECRSRRAVWLKDACALLGLPNASVIGSRLEQVKTRACSVISARAFAPLGRLFELSARFSDPGTCWLLPKGRSAAHELKTLTGWRQMFHVEPSLTDPEAGLIVGQLFGKTTEHG